MVINIPQIFYDIIGRLVPGSLLFAFIPMVFPNLRPYFHELLCEANSSNVAAIALSFVSASFCYSLGISLGHLSTAFKGPRKCLHKRFSTLLTRWISRKSPACLGVCLLRTFLEVWPKEETTESITRLLPEAGARIVKLNAERCFARVMTIGSVSLMIILLFCREDSSYDIISDISVRGLFVLVVCNIIFYRHVQNRLRKLTNELLAEVECIKANQASSAST